MERGELAPGGAPATIFVFDELIAHCTHPKIESLAIKSHRWQVAFDCWELDHDICNYIGRLVHVYFRPVEIITWRPPGFADVVNTELYRLDVPVRHTTSREFEYLSPQLATDTDVDTVYDPDPEHRWSYGFKAREFDLGQL